MATFAVVEHSISGVQIRANPSAGSVVPRIASILPLQAQADRNQSGCLGQRATVTDAGRLAPEGSKV